MKRQYRVFFARCELGQSRNQIRTIGSELEQRPLFLLIGIGLLLLLLLGDLLERLRDRYTPEQNGGQPCGIANCHCPLVQCHRTLVCGGFAGPAKCSVYGLCKYPVTYPIAFTTASINTFDGNGLVKNAMPPAAATLRLIVSSSNAVMNMVGYL